MPPIDDGDDEDNDEPESSLTEAYLYDLEDKPKQERIRRRKPRRGEDEDRKGSHRVARQGKW